MTRCDAYVTSKILMLDPRLRDDEPINAVVVNLPDQVVSFQILKSEIFLCAVFGLTDRGLRKGKLPPTVSLCSYYHVRGLTANIIRTIIQSANPVSAVIEDVENTVSPISIHDLSSLCKCRLVDEILFCLCHGGLRRDDDLVCCYKTRSDRTGMSKRWIQHKSTMSRFIPSKNMVPALFCKHIAANQISRQGRARRLPRLCSIG